MVRSAASFIDRAKNFFLAASASNRDLSSLRKLRSEKSAPTCLSLAAGRELLPVPFLAVGPVAGGAEGPGAEVLGPGAEVLGPVAGGAEGPVAGAADGPLVIAVLAAADGEVTETAETAATVRAEIANFIAYVVLIFVIFIIL